jgi:hypothetical protein
MVVLGSAWRAAISPAVGLDARRRTYGDHALSQVALVDLHVSTKINRPNLPVRQT